MIDNQLKVGNKKRSKAKRQLKVPKRNLLKPRTWLRNQPLPPRRKISSTVSLIKQAIKLIKKDWRTHLGITAFYLLGLFIFVRSFSLNGEGAGESLSSSTTGFFDKLFGGVIDLGTLVADANVSMSAASGVYQIFISTVITLAIIWTFRKTLSHEKTSVKDSFYNGMTPLIPYLLVFMMILVHLIPIAIVSYLYSLVVSSALLVGWENLVAIIIVILATIWSFYLVTHSLFALFIATLPNMNPVRALRGAKKMVYRRRLQIWRKIVLFAIVLGLLALLIMLPIIFWAPVLAPYVVFVLSGVALVVVQAFLYAIYREIL